MVAPGKHCVASHRHGSRGAGASLSRMSAMVSRMEFATVVDWASSRFSSSFPVLVVSETCSDRYWLALSDCVDAENRNVSATVAAMRRTTVMTRVFICEEIRKEKQK